jgi:ATP adenylyltransferase
MAYIENHPSDEGCIFCQILSMPDGPQNLVLLRTDRSFLVLNRYPYTSGHLMVVPLVHRNSLEGLDPAIRADMMELTTRAVSLLQDTYKPQGFNIGINLGEAAGAGILDHIHLHIVPRWTGDTNFMSSLAETRVLPESLEETYQRLKTRLPVS